MRCPRCGHENLEGVAYCSGCLKPMDEQSVLGQAFRGPRPIPPGFVPREPSIEPRIRSVWAGAAAPDVEVTVEEVEGPTTDRSWLSAADAAPAAHPVPPPLPQRRKPRSPRSAGPKSMPPPLPPRLQAQRAAKTAGVSSTDLEAYQEKLRKGPNRAGTMAMLGCGFAMFLMVGGGVLVSVISTATDDEPEATVCDEHQLDGCREVCEAIQPNQCRARSSECAVSAGACLRLARAYRTGDGAKQAKATALRYYGAACKLGNPDGCNEQGYMVLNGQGARLDEKGAAKLFEQGCDGPHWACLNLGLMYFFGRGVEQNGDRANQLFKGSCRLTQKWELKCSPSHPDTCGTGAVLTAIGACGQADIARARANAAMACSAGYAWPCDRIDEVAGGAVAPVGGECRPGRTAACRTQCDAIESEQCGARPTVCAQSADACNTLGWMYQKGQGARRDAAQAARAFYRACTLGGANGCDSLGFMVQNGQGARQNESQALKLFEKACETEPFACLNLGLMLHFGRGAPRDTDRAAQLFGKHCSAAKNWGKDCERGAQEECGTGALLTAIGACGVEDRRGAWLELVKACAGGYDWPCQRFKEIPASE